MGKAARNGQTAAHAELNYLQSGKLEQSIPELDFVSYLTGGANVNVASHSFGKGMAENSVQSYPIEKIQLDRKSIASLDDKAMINDDPLKKKFSAGFANQIMKLINQTDIEKASMVGRAGAIAKFDESLGALTMIGSTDPDYLAR
jgi:hypothetical protein